MGGGREEGGAVDDDLVDGGGDLRRHHLHLVLPDQMIPIDRIGEEPLERVHSGSDGGEVEQRVPLVVLRGPGRGLERDTVKVAGV